MNLALTFFPLKKKISRSKASFACILNQKVKNLFLYFLYLCLIIFALHFLSESMDLYLFLLLFSLFMLSYDLIFIWIVLETQQPKPQSLSYKLTLYLTSIDKWTQNIIMKNICFILILRILVCNFSIQT